MNMHNNDENNRERQHLQPPTQDPNEMEIQPSFRPQLSLSDFTPTPSAHFTSFHNTNVPTRLSNLNSATFRSFSEREVELGTDYQLRAQDVLCGFPKSYFSTVLPHLLRCSPNISHANSMINEEGAFQDFATESTLTLQHQRQWLQQHPGNERFRELVELRYAGYRGADNRSAKSKIVWQVVDKIRADGGHFVKLVDNTWYDIGNAKAREKAGAAIRSGAAAIEIALPREAASPSEQDFSCSPSASPSSDSQAALGSSYNREVACKSPDKDARRRWSMDEVLFQTSVSCSSSDHDDESNRKPSPKRRASTGKGKRQLNKSIRQYQKAQRNELRSGSKSVKSLGDLGEAGTVTESSHLFASISLASFSSDEYPLPAAADLAAFFDQTDVDQTLRAPNHCARASFPAATATQPVWKDAFDNDPG